MADEDWRLTERVTTYETAFLAAGYDRLERVREFGPVTGWTLSAFAAGAEEGLLSSDGVLNHTG